MKSLKKLVSLFMPLFIIAQTVRAENEGTMLWLSDIHFDPFYGGDVLKLANTEKTGWRYHRNWPPILKQMTGNQHLAPAGSDANSLLLERVLHRAKSQMKTPPDFVLLTGDFLSHNFSDAYFNGSGLPNSLATAALHNQFVDETMAYLAYSISATFPDVPVIAALGNNDAYCGDYDIRGNSGFLARTRATFRQYFLPSLSEDFQTTAGCYVTNIPGTKHQFVVLNSVPYMLKYPEADWIADIKPLHNSCGPLRTVNLEDQFEWLTGVMQRTSPEKRTWLVCHVPPGVSCYGGTQNWGREVQHRGKQSRFVDVFHEFYIRHQSQLAGVLAAHSHAAEFKLIRQNGSTSPVAGSVLMAPSIGRNHRNNSSFRILKFDRATLGVTDYVTHWLDGAATPPVWRPPFSFVKTYGVADVSPESLHSIFRFMQTGQTAPTGKSYLNQYFYDYSTRNGAGNNRPRAHYLNALGNITGP